ncbi:hypothetical protein [Actinoplanes sp. NBRC 101535]|uniref:hypothetical protein n=1 Tax=Actinoplanes sp. NBRC 101535 TaxID=3032196 RepID=UPI0024A0A588|nr:hypothetical protein [Actinoplanes sp. NBRC 101535]GLY02350.1 hypothetical protein Acsp01_27290 [Actinoplanes sp. NBRC 101535]
MIDFNLITPTGWVRIPTTPDTSRLRERVITGVVRTVLPDDLPRDKAGPWRRMLHRQLTEAAGQAEQQGARSVVVPVQEMYGMRLPGTLVLSIVEDDEPQDPRALLAAIVADAGPGGEILDIGGCPAARVQTVIASDTIKRKAPSIRVNYYVCAPGHPGVWGVLTYTVLTDGDVEADAVQAVVLMFDAVVATLQWGDPGDHPSES